MLEFMVGAARRALMVLFVGVGIVVLASSLNLATSLLARSAGRREEYAVRMSLGGGQGVIGRHAILEGLMLSFTGGLLGALLAVLARQGLMAVIGDSVPRAWAITLDAQVLGFSVLLSVVVGVLMAALPGLASGAWRPGTLPPDRRTRAAHRARLDGSWTAWLDLKWLWRSCFWSGPDSCFAPSSAFSRSASVSIPTGSRWLRSRCPSRGTRTRSPSRPRCSARSSTTWPRRTESRARPTCSRHLSTRGAVLGVR